MEVNADFERRVVVHGGQIPWVPSPIPGVSRRMLDRIGDEVARATTIVRYDPGSRFKPHVHGGGEEFLVLQGVFQDEHGDFGPGAYVRNPPTSSHTPGSAEGCVILVKLWQFDPDDRTPVIVDTRKMGRVRDAERPGVAVTPLFEDHRETVQLEVWDPGASVTLALPEGGEFFVVEGSMDERGDALGQHSWLRLPVAGVLQATAGPRGARIWAKTRHLPHACPPAPR